MNHYWEVIKHKIWVLRYCLRFCFKLIGRCILHDFSKFNEQEAKLFIELTPRLKTTVYGSEEYKKCLEDLKPALRHHYNNNPHHPEYHCEVGGYKNMSSLDRIEMVFDWMASIKRSKDGDINKSLEVNQKRFNYTDADTEWLRKIIEDIK